MDQHTGPKSGVGILNFMEENKSEINDSNDVGRALVLSGLSPAITLCPDSPMIGKLSAKMEAAGKVRIFAMVDA